MRRTKTTTTTERTEKTEWRGDSDSDSETEGVVVVPVVIPVPVLIENGGGEARREVDNMMKKMNEMQVRTEQLQNHAREKLQEAEEIQKKKFMDEAMIKKVVGSIVTVAGTAGIALGVKFGLF